MNNLKEINDLKEKKEEPEIKKAIKSKNNIYLSLEADSKENKLFQITSFNDGGGIGRLELLADEIQLNNFQFLDNKIKAGGNSLNIDLEFEGQGEGKYHFLSSKETSSKIILYQKKQTNFESEIPNNIEIQCPIKLKNNYKLILPNELGKESQVLSVNSENNLEWIYPVKLGNVISGEIKDTFGNINVGNSDIKCNLLNAKTVLCNGLSMNDDMTFKKQKTFINCQGKRLITVDINNYNLGFNHLNDNNFIYVKCEEEEYEKEMNGLLVSYTGNIFNYDKEEKIKDTGVLGNMPVVKLCDRSRLLAGVITGIEDDERKLDMGSFGVLYKKEDNLSRWKIATTGHISIWVIINSFTDFIKVGQPIYMSPIPGYATINMEHTNPIGRIVMDYEEDNEIPNRLVNDDGNIDKEGKYKCYLLLCKLTN